MLKRVLRDRAPATAEAPLASSRRFAVAADRQSSFRVLCSVASFSVRFTDCYLASSNCGHAIAAYFPSVFRETSSTVCFRRRFVTTMAGSARHLRCS